VIIKGLRPPGRPRRFGKRPDLNNKRARNDKSYKQLITGHLTGEKAQSTDRIIDAFAFKNVKPCPKPNLLAEAEKILAINY
jgi:hypothetical protein